MHIWPAASKHVLKLKLCDATGSQVWAFAHGLDDRIVEPPKARKSVGAECNWGIRFTSDADALTFMDNLAGELSTRMKGVVLTQPLLPQLFVAV